MKEIRTELLSRVVLVDYRDESPYEYPLVYDQRELKVELDLQDDERTLKIFIAK